MLTEPGRTSLGADLKLLNDNAVPADCNLYDKCLKRYRAVCAAPGHVFHIATASFPRSLLSLITISCSDVCSYMRTVMVI